MNDQGLPVVGFAAYSGTGKTTLLSNVIPVLRSRGLRVAVIKHAHHSFVIDTPGKDSYEFRSAGAEQVLIASRQLVAWLMERSNSKEPELTEALGYIDSAEIDLIIVEGFKKEPFTKIEVYRSTVRYSPLANDDAHVVGVATDNPEIIDADVPVLDLNDYESIADFIMEKMERGMLTMSNEVG